MTKPICWTETVTGYADPGRMHRPRRKFSFGTATLSLVGAHLFRYKCEGQSPRRFRMTMTVEEVPDDRPRG